MLRLRRLLVIVPLLLLCGARSPTPPSPLQLEDFGPFRGKWALYRLDNARRIVHQGRYITFTGRQGIVTFENGSRDALVFTIDKIDTRKNPPGIDWIVTVDGRRAAEQFVYRIDGDMLILNQYAATRPKKVVDKLEQHVGGIAWLKRAK